MFRHIDDAVYVEGHLFGGGRPMFVTEAVGISTIMGGIERMITV